MNCEEIRGLIDAYADGEVDLVRSLEIEGHLESCTECPKRFGDLQGLRKMLQAARLRETAPERLERWAARQNVPEAEKQRESFRKPLWTWGPVGALALGMAGVLIAVPALLRRTGEQRLAQEIVSAHVRSLMGSHLTDITSTDQHNVKPWFNGKLDYAPFVRDLSEFGYPLAGGRLDYVAQRPVAALVYRRRQHVINLILWPSVQEQDRNLTLLSQRGYNLAHWTKGNMTFWAVSDLNSQDLQQFCQIIQSQALLPGTF